MTNNITNNNPKFLADYEKKYSAASEAHALKMQELENEYLIRQRIWDVAQVEVNEISTIPVQENLIIINIRLGTGYKVLPYGNKVLDSLLTVFKAQPMCFVEGLGSTSFYSKNWVEHGNNTESKYYKRVMPIAPVTVHFQTDSDTLKTKAVAKWYAYVAGSNRFCEFNVSVPIELTGWGEMMAYKMRSGNIDTDRLTPAPELGATVQQYARPTYDQFSNKVMYFVKGSLASEFTPLQWAQLMYTKAE